MGWECVPPGNGLDSVSQCQPSCVEVFAFFEPADVNIIGGPRRVGQQHHVGASYQEQANGLADALAL